MILQFAQNCSTGDIVIGKIQLIAEKGERKYSAKKWKPIQLNQNSYHQNIFAFEMSLRSQIGWNEIKSIFIKFDDQTFACLNKCTAKID